MSKAKMHVVPLSQMIDGQDADTFALLASKEELRTRDGKPYFRVTFRDASREVTFPIWNDTPLAKPCREEWTPGTHYKLRATYRETSYGPQLDIRRIRAVNEDDRSDGFDPLGFLPQSRFNPAEMFDQLRTLVEQEITDEPVRLLLLALLDDRRDALLTLPAAKRNHHAFAGGWLEHVLNVTRNALWLADRYIELYPEMQPPLERNLVVAGAVLHDIGKLRELAWQTNGAGNTPEGVLIGHVLQGRDILREAAREHPIPAETLLRLEHVIVSHHDLPEWGSPKSPMTPEAMLIHAVDHLDARMAMFHDILRHDTSAGPLTSGKNVLGRPVFRGGV